MEKVCGRVVRLSTSALLLRVPAVNGYNGTSATLAAWHSPPPTRSYFSGSYVMSSSLINSESNRYNFNQRATFNNLFPCSENREISCLWSLTQRRYYWRHKTPRAPYTKPVSFDYSGDLTMSLGTIDLSRPKLGFENVEELKNADESVKKIFSLEFGTNSAMIHQLTDDLMSKVMDHPLDLRSLELIIAKDTIHIRNGIRHCVRFRHDKRNKCFLIKRIFRRRRHLADLKSKDIEKFNWLVSELKLRHIEPTKFDNWKLSRKGLRKKIARDAALALKKEKMAIFKIKLEQEKVIFEKQKEAELTQIEEELKELGINEMTTLNGTLESLGMSHMMPKPGPKMTRRATLLLKKFELYGEQKKIKDDEILKAHGFLTEKEMPYLPA